MNDVVHLRRGRRARRWGAMAGLVLPLLLLLACEEETTGLPRGFTESTAFSGLANPTAVTFAPDGRVFVAE